MALIITVQNCAWAFEVQCPKEWSRMRSTKDPDVKLCETCLKQVHRVKTEEDAVEQAKQGKCVALEQHNDEVEYLVGLIGPIDE